MIIEKIICPYGCSNSLFIESTKTIMAPNTNLLLDSKKQAQTQVEVVKCYTCQCCGRGFETHQPTSSKVVL